MDTTTVNRKEEIWEVWNQEPLTQKFMIDNFLYYGLKGLIVNLSDENENKINVIFNKGVEHFCFTDEGCINVAMNEFNTTDPRGHVRGYNNFKVSNSSILKRILAHEGEVVWNPKEIIHYVFGNNDGIFEVLSHGKPDIKIIKKT